MREFAKEMSQAGPEAIIRKPGVGGLPAPQQQKQWDDPAARYPFLDWNHGTGTVIVRGGIVELTWGSALTGHWGFQVAPDGVVKDVEEDRGAVLRVAPDIQFIYVD